MTRFRIACASALAALVLAAPTFAETQTLTIGVKRHMEATLFAPDGPGPYPGVLILHTSGGLKSADLDYAKRLTEQGYVTLVPAFMEAYGITAMSRVQTFTSDAENVYGDLANGADVLRAHPKVAGGKIAAIGFSNGGYFAMWLAGSSKIDAGISYYGALSGAGSDKTLSRFRSVFNEKSSPILILHGTSDRTVPVASAERLADIAQEAGSPFAIQLYKNADHQFERDLRNDAMRAAAEDAWGRTLAFLQARLGRM